MDESGIDSEARDRELDYRGFLDDEATVQVYKNKVKRMIEKKKTRLIVNIDDIRSNINLQERAKGLIENSTVELISFQKALKEYVTSLNVTYGGSHYEFLIGLSGNFGSRRVTPRSLTAEFINNTICLEGIVSKMSVPKQKLIKSVYYCPNTKRLSQKYHYDVTSLEFRSSFNFLLKHDEDGNPLEIEHGLCLYKRHQTITIQEMPELAPSGQLPRSVDVVLERDLVDSCKPGDKVHIVGSYRCKPHKNGNYTSGRFKNVLFANNVITQIKDGFTTQLSNSVLKQIVNFSREIGPGILDLMARSLAPTIFGHEKVKKAIVCILLGGNELITKGGMRIGGDINVLLVGDPSVAKSQFLRFVLQIAPIAVASTGRGSTGVGLTAAITNDPETGDRQIEAGATVLADRRIVCIDEFDKMSDTDRTAIHSFEVMEQGRVSI